MTSPSEDLQRGAPRAVLALGAGADADAVRACIAAGIDWLEFRIDAFPRQDPAAVCAELERFAGAFRLATIRSAAEGGAWPAARDAERLELYRALLPHAEAVDVEISAGIGAAAIAAAHAAGRVAVASFHDFAGMPARAALEAVLAKGRRAGADLIKIAATCNTRADLRALAAFTLDHAAEPIATIGMGPEGCASRIFFPALGSRLTYTFLGAPTAPGQLTCAETLGYLEAFYPERRRAARQ